MGPPTSCRAGQSPAWPEGLPQREDDKRQQQEAPMENAFVEKEERFHNRKRRRLFPGAPSAFNQDQGSEPSANE